MTERTHGRSDGVTRIARRQLMRAGGALMGAAALLKVAPSVGASTRLAPTASEEETGMVYHIEGRLLEVCTCNILCPCWVGEDPDGGVCDSAFGWQVDKGTIEGVDVSGRTLGMAVHIPGNVLAGGWKAVVYVDDQSTE